jgi:hypothetical protein
MRTIASLLAALFFPLAALAGEPNPDDTVNNPPFAHWSAFPVGTTVTQKEIVTLPDARIEQTFTFKLLQKTADHVVVEMTRADAATAGSAQETTVTTYPAKVKRKEVDTPNAALVSLKEGETQIELHGKKIDTEWVEAVTHAAGEEVTEQVFTARDVPGGLVKQTLTRKRDGKVVAQSQREVTDVKPGS